jgi:hypothetical protein
MGQAESSAELDAGGESLSAAAAAAAMAAPRFASERRAGLEGGARLRARGASLLAYSPRTSAGVPNILLL